MGQAQPTGLPWLLQGCLYGARLTQEEHTHARINAHVHTHTCMHTHTCTWSSSRLQPHVLLALTASIYPGSKAGNSIHFCYFVETR